MGDLKTGDRVEAVFSGSVYDFDVAGEVIVDWDWPWTNPALDLWAQRHGLPKLKGSAMSADLLELSSEAAFRRAQTKRQLASATYDGRLCPHQGYANATEQEIADGQRQVCGDPAPFLIEGTGYCGVHAKQAMIDKERRDDGD
tara:strand:+ start:1102 stop:1530 length:429 start_codon:yes stop_codon:yes gene_type:complete